MLEAGDVTGLEPVQAPAGRSAGRLGPLGTWHRHLPDLPFERETMNANTSCPHAELNGAR